MHDAFQPQDRSRRYRGVALVVALHLLLVWALVSGTARQQMDVLTAPPQAVVIQEVSIPPPPPPPPPPLPKEIRPPQARAPRIQAAAPPPFVPPPEVPVAVAAAPTMAATPTPPVAPPAIGPPSLSAAPGPAAPGAAAGTGAAPSMAKAPSRADIGVDCPTQVKPVYPRTAVRAGVEGVVKVEALVRDGAIDDKDIRFVSGPVVLRAAVRNALRQYKCAREPAEYLVTQEFPFKLGE